uniref:Uncharacterized protein n=2 Tax=Thermorudis TaxID=1649508 RepID=A0A7C2ZYB4_9BACT
MTETKPWERLPGEPAKAYHAFTIYRDLSPKERSLRRVAEVLGYGRSKDKKGRLKVPATIEKWSRRYRWVDRALAWDDEQDRLRREAQREAVEEMLRRHAQEAVALQTKALQRLRELDPSELSPGDVLRYFIEAAKLERISRGEPETITEERHPWIDAVIRAWERRVAKPGE